MTFQEELEKMAAEYHGEPPIIETKKPVNPPKISFYKKLHRPKLFNYNIRVMKIDSNWFDKGWRVFRFVAITIALFILYLIALNNRYEPIGFGQAMFDKWTGKAYKAQWNEKTGTAIYVERSK